MAILAIGDLHGNLRGLNDLLLKVIGLGFDLNDTQVVFVGDYIDRGRENPQLIDYMMSFQEMYPQTITLMGNHEDMMLNALGMNSIVGSHLVPKGDWGFWLGNGGQATLDQYRARYDTSLDAYQRSLIPAMTAIPASHIMWVKGLDLSAESNKFIFVHAGLRPGLTEQTTTPTDKLWIRDEFLGSDHDFGKIIVHGHSHRGKVERRPNRINVAVQDKVGAVLLDDETGEVVHVFNG